MTEEPYRWVEAIANRREYVEDQLRRGSPIVLLNFSDGLLLLTVSRETRKIFEIYDRVGFAALGHPADIERMRLAAIDLAHVEGFNRAAEDVSLRRLVNYGLSPALKTAFEQVFAAPHIVKMVMAELGAKPDDDLIVKLDYDGSLARSEIEMKEPFDVLAGTAKAEDAMLQYLVKNNGNPRRSLDDAIRLAAQTWAVGMHAVTDSSEEPDTVRILREHLKTRHVEAAVLERSRSAAGKFRLLDEKEIHSAVKDL